MGEVRLKETEISNRFVPVVLGGDVLAYAYSRCFHEAYGVKTVILSAVDVRVTSSSRFCDYRVTEAMAQGEECILRLLEELGREWQREEKVVLLLGSADWHVRLLSKNKERLSAYYVIPYLDFALLDTITQKANFYALCDELGMDYPKTWRLSCSNPEDNPDVAEFPYPVVAKPSNSAHYDQLMFAGKQKIYDVSSADQMTEIFKNVQGSGYQDDLLVQEFVPGDDDAICTLTTYSDENGQVRVVSGGRVVLQDHSPAKIGNPLTIMLERHEQLIEDAKRFCARTGYHGFANFDAKFDCRDGSYKFFEVNARPGANTYYMAVGGVNFATLWVDDFILGKYIDYQEAYTDRVYTLLPVKAIDLFVSNEELKRKVLDCYKSGRADFLYNAAGESLSHRFWAWAKGKRQVQKLSKYMPR